MNKLCPDAFLECPTQPADISLYGHFYSEVLVGPAPWLPGSQAALHYYCGNQSIMAITP